MDGLIITPTPLEVGLVGYIIIKEIIPWFLRTFFPAIWSEKVERRKSADEIKREESQYRRDMAQREIDIKRELAEKELELRKEIADRDAIIDARNLKIMESMEHSISRLTEAVAAQTMQFTIMGREFNAMKTDQQAYFADGRKAIQQINAMATPKKQVRKKG
jgi:hypothetical protein